MQEPYQAALDGMIDTELRQFVMDESLHTDIKSGLSEPEVNDSKVLIAPVSSGSAVIADEQKMREIVGQQRKMAALEMEMYSMYEAAKQSLYKPLFFGAKAVADLGDENKGDTYHASAAILSARFVARFIEWKLTQPS